MKKLHEEIYKQGFLEAEAYAQLKALDEKKLVSVYYELRFVMYVGILLLSGGLGMLVYNSGSQWIHVALMFLLVVAIGACFVYVQKHALGYSNAAVTHGHALVDYGVLLMALLIVALFTYVMVYFDLLELLLQTSSLLSAGVFTYLAYRYDHKAVLAMGITAFAAAFGLQLSPVSWANGFTLEGDSIYFVAIALGLFYLTMGWLSVSQAVKPHFRFTYDNFGFMLLYTGAMAVMFQGGEVVGWLLFFATLYILVFTWQSKAFLFFLYAFATLFVVVTYGLFAVIHDEVFWVYYFPFTMILSVVLLVKHKSHFSYE